jgi:L-ornithine N5-oxygenase
MTRVDVLGIGFGPSNIAMAIAFEESHPELSVMFVETKESFSWHENLMFPEAEMQVSFLKDLISMRNPQSRYTFLSYLHARGRLHEFINLRTFFPTRVEFNDYYEWVADQFSSKVTYGSSVESVTRVGPEDLLVSVRNHVDGTLTEIVTGSLIVANGGSPHVPDNTVLGPRLFHASESRARLELLFPDRDSPYAFNIVGGGQTTADLFIYLSSQYPNASITTSIRAFAMRPEDDTHFVNELFFPEMPDWFYQAAPEVRSKVLAEYASAAHSGASYDLIPRIYRTRYEARVTGSDRYRFDRLVEFVGGTSSEHSAEATYRSLENSQITTSSYDAVILATGYRYPSPLPLLDGVGDYLETDSHGSYRINRDYSVSTTEDIGPRIFLQGYAESTHGFSEVLLSLMPERAAEIADSVARSRALLTAAL